jgi:phosphoribosylformylglycinamidine synthase subunit PurQ / glutaminase
MRQNRAGRRGASPPAPTMPSLQALVLRSAGTNCDGETVRALSLAGASADLVHLARVIAEPARLDAYALVVLPGGFSYGDDVAAGRVFGLELRHHLRAALGAFVERGGHVLGVCNGFQILIEAGLLDAAPELGRAMPGRADRERETARVRDVTLCDNASDRFECRWVTLREEACAASWLVPGALLRAPVAHAEGRFVVRDAATLERLRAARQVALRYVAFDAAETPVLPAPYPANPNGSVDDIAGICDPTGRVLGLMPHPERNVAPWHDPAWTRREGLADGAGLAFWRRLVEAAAAVPV